MLVLLLWFLAQPSDDAAREAAARAVLAKFTAGQFEAMQEGFDAKMRQALPPARLAAFAQQFAAQAGAFQSVRDVKQSSEQGRRGVTLVCQYEKAPFDVHVAFDADGKVGGLLFRPSSSIAAPTRFADYADATVFHLPFEGHWFVVWGGRTIAENYHAATVDQRFAYDIVVVRDGATHPAGAKDNAAYYCWNAAITAPADGVITEAVDGIDDNVPGVTNPAAAAGNHVVIDHGHGEYALLGHFRRGTLAVKTGDHVTAGALLGRCGNSGNSSEPHLHIHLQNAPRFGSGEGLPMQFHDYCADDKPVAAGEPKKGQTIGACRK